MFRFVQIDLYLSIRFPSKFHYKFRFYWHFSTFFVNNIYNFRRSFYNFLHIYFNLVRVQFFVRNDRNFLGIFYFISIKSIIYICIYIHRCVYIYMYIYVYAYIKDFSVTFSWNFIHQNFTDYILEIKVCFKGYFGTFRLIPRKW